MEYTNDLVAQRKAIYVFNTYERTHYLYWDSSKHTSWSRKETEAARARARRQKGERRETDSLQRVQGVEILSFSHKFLPCVFGGRFGDCL